jgi:multiple sugar transport system ATP-binding protein
MAAVVLNKLRKVYGTVVAIPSLDLAIKDGEFVSLLGPSGCGKTTTLRMLAGLERPTAGRLIIGDRVVNDVPPGQRDIAMVFQSYALYPHLTVAENIAYPLRKRGVPRVERPALVQRAADLLQLGPLLDRKPRQLSGGQQQRVALGRALVRDPQLFLLDEPLSNLDAKLRAHMRAELIELHRRVGRTMVYVTHDQLEAMTMSTRIAVMQGGELQQFATPDDVYRRPANVFVASFIGTPSMAIVNGELTGERLRFGVVNAALPAGYLAPAASQAAKVGTRPEDIRIGTGPYQARVRVVEPAGHECIVLLDAGGAELTARLPGDARVAIDEIVPFDLRVDRLHVFDGPSGRRLNLDNGEGPVTPALSLSA